MLKKILTVLAAVVLCIALPACTWSDFLEGLKTASKTALNVAYTASKALYTLTSNLTADELTAYLKSWGIDDDTVEEIVSQYKAGGATVAAAYKIAEAINAAAAENTTATTSN